jgi:hypothetical protein
MWFAYIYLLAYLVCLGVSLNERPGLAGVERRFSRNRLAKVLKGASGSPADPRRQYGTKNTLLRDRGAIDRPFARVSPLSPAGQSQAEWAGGITNGGWLAVVEGAGWQAARLIGWPGCVGRLASVSRLCRTRMAWNEQIGWNGILGGGGGRAWCMMDGHFAGREGLGGKKKQTCRSHTHLSWRGAGKTRLLDAPDPAAMPTHQPPFACARPDRTGKTVAGRLSAGVR